MQEKTPVNSISITLIDDDSKKRFSLLKELESFGHQVYSLDNINRLTNQPLSKISHIYIFNNLTPSQQNITKLKNLNLSQNSGIIFISDENNIENRIFALEEYADIFLSRPIELRELNAYIKSLCRRIQPKIQQSSKKINIKQRLLISQDNQILNLSKIDFIILNLLTNKTHAVITKTEIAQELEISSPDYHKQLNTIMCRLRKKLHDFDKELVIQTIRETGYTYYGPQIIFES